MAELAELCDGDVIFYARRRGPLPVIAAHRAGGERAVFVRDGAIVLAEGGDETALLAWSALKPATAAVSRQRAGGGGGGLGAGHASRT